mmetsp:Transcript_866/g.1845  ORF Transcript_866/g.1845 Transcript_866/m.1845 type:complete len:87 (+) Transcript_866:11-271(+)
MGSSSKTSSVSIIGNASRCHRASDPCHKMHSHPARANLLPLSRIGKVKIMSMIMISTTYLDMSEPFLSGQVPMTLSLGWIQLVVTA